MRHVDEESRKLKQEWKRREREAARAAFPLPDAELAALFAALDAGLERAGCDHSLRLTLAWLDEHTRAPGPVVTWLEDNGGDCDCEVAANARDHWEQSR